MRKSKFGLIAITVAFLISGSAVTRAAGAGPYQSDKTFHIGREGGWDYLTVDSEHHILYVPRSTHTQVINAETGRIVGDIGGQKRCHGVAVDPSAGRGFISDGKDGSVVIFDLKTFAVDGKVAVAEDADGIIYDATSDKILVACGDANALAVISPNLDPKKGKPDAIIDLGGKPEFLVADGAGNVFVNLEDKDEVAVVDLKSAKVVKKYPVAPGGSPVGISIDRDHRRLFIGCRNPQKMIVMGCDDGKVLADLPIGAGVDATQFDSPYALASCRDGTLAVIQETNPGYFDLVQTVQTKAGARTMGLDSSRHTIYLPTADLLPAASPHGRASAKPDSFMILTVSRLNS